MDGVTAEAWLTQEARDLLDEGPVGLYEFVWRLNSSSYDLSERQRVELSRRVARRLLDDGRAQIFAVTWPDFEIVAGPLAAVVLDEPGTWSEGESGPLMALVPTGSGPERPRS